MELVLLARISALKNSFQKLIPNSSGYYEESIVKPLIGSYVDLIDDFIELDNELYKGVGHFKINAYIFESQSKDVIYTVINGLDYILSLKNNLSLGEKYIERVKSKRIFISHGRSGDWREVQAYLERDLKISTLELAQEPNLGRTVLNKLGEESDKCGAAVIVMTGDDISDDGIHKARENVMHEMGFFQGRYGSKNVIVLHENDVNIPSNIGGLVYIGFPKNTIEATFGALHRELKVIFP